MTQAYHNVGKHVVCGMDGTRKICSRGKFSGPFVKTLAIP